MNTLDLREALIEKQRQAGWSYHRMARELGIGYTTWYRTASGERRMTLKTVRRVLARFPDLQPLAFLYLQPDVTMGTNPDSQRNSSDAA